MRTAYRDSKNYRGNKISVKFQGLCHGNGDATDGWAVIIITILNAHKKKGHGGKFVCQILQRTGHLAAILFVDNNDLIILTWIKIRRRRRHTRTYRQALTAGVSY